MNTHKIIYLVFLIIGLTSCKEKVSKAEYDEILSEYKELKEVVGESQSLNLKNARTLNQTLTELANISDNTMLLRQDLETGTAQIKQAEQITGCIISIKNKIKKLEKQNEANPEFRKTIQNLKIVITEKEKEIIKLKRIIASQDNIISQKEEVIQIQSNTISQKESELRQAINEQAYLLFQAGEELEYLADNAPDVSRKKNKKKIDEYQKRILQKSLFYYEKASLYGYDEAKKKADRLRMLIK